MEDIIRDFISSEDVFIPTMIASAILLAILIKSISRVIRSVAGERTRREIAAYIAEGSMTPEQGERLLASGTRRGCN